MLNRPTDPRNESTPTTGSGSAAFSAARSPNPDVRGQLRATAPTQPRRVVDMPGSAPVSNAARRPPVDGPRYGQGEGRRMVVARDITLAGQISKCDTLIVEGAVEGMRYDGQSLEIADGGSFNGSIEVDSAEIAGSFDGVMLVRGRLSVRPTGRITGTVRYGEIEINAGGQINGELQGMQTNAPRVSAPLSSSVDVEEDDEDMGTSSVTETASASA